MKLYIIFVNYNSGNQLYDGLRSVLKSNAASGVIIVDNGSTDNSLGIVNKLKNFKKIIIIKNATNIGFYKALNIGIKRALSLGAEAVMPLDFDLEFNYDFISKLSKVNGDIVAPVLKFKKNGKWFYDYGGRINWIKGQQYHILKTFPKKISSSVSSATSHNNVNWFDYVSGGCTVFRKEVFKKLGYFDEDYFVYWGDADFVIQASRAGLSVIMDGNTIVYHKMEISGQTGNLHKLKISFFDNVKFIKKRIKKRYKIIAYLNILYLVTKTIFSVLTVRLRSLSIL